MINATPAYLSQEKSDELQAELHRLKMIERKAIAEQLEYAKSLGDLSENAEYHEAREDQANTERRIVDLEILLKDVEVVKKHHSEEVEIGSVAIVQKEGEKEKRTYQIVGSAEADSAKGKISNVSPLGEALMGRKKGEIASFQIPAGEVKYKIIDIE